LAKNVILSDTRAPHTMQPSFLLQLQLLPTAGYKDPTESRGKSSFHPKRETQLSPSVVSSQLLYLLFTTLLLYTPRLSDSALNRLHIYPVLSTYEDYFQPVHQPLISLHTNRKRVKGDSAEGTDWRTKEFPARFFFRSPWSVRMTRAYIMVQSITFLYIVFVEAPSFTLRRGRKSVEWKLEKVVGL